MKTASLFIREIFKIAVSEETIFSAECEELPLRLKLLVLKIVYLYLKINNFLLDTYYRFRARGCFGLRAFYWFAFHGMILLRPDDDELL